MMGKNNNNNNTLKKKKKGQQFMIKYCKIYKEVLNLRRKTTNLWWKKLKW